LDMPQKPVASVQEGAPNLLGDNDLVQGLTAALTQRFGQLEQNLIKRLEILEHNFMQRVDRLELLLQGTHASTASVHTDRVD
jgi:hypothetical protein